MTQTPSPTPRTWQAFEALVDAEEYFTFFDLPFDPQVVNVNRLHILQKFSRNLEAIEEAGSELTETERLTLARQALQEAYQTFLDSNAQAQKLFKVFNQKPQGVVLISEITSS